MKILLTGSNGQVGWELTRTLLPLGEVVAPPRSQVDLYDLGSMRRSIAEIKPDVIVNAAAYTAVDKAETDEVSTYKINRDAPNVLAEEAKRYGALLIHYSTDYVFDGSKSEPYREHDEVCPINCYGQSKLAGEQAIQAVGSDYLILRTSWVYAARGSNFLKTVLRLAAEREELRIVADQIGAPTWARLIAETTAHVIKQSVSEQRQGNFQSDIYHLTSAGEASWCDFACAIVEMARQSGTATLKNRIITPIPTSDYPTPARRPANSRLSIARLEKRFQLRMPSWQQALTLCMAEVIGD